MSGAFTRRWSGFNHLGERAVRAAVGAIIETVEPRTMMSRDVGDFASLARLPGRTRPECYAGPALQTVEVSAPPSQALAPDTRVPLSQLPQLSNRPGAPRTLFLDFDGDAAATWNNGIATYQVSGPLAGNTDPVPAFDWDGNPTDFSTSELAAINTMWSIVAEKYSPFDINVTTVDPGNLTNDVTQKVIIGGSPRDWYQPGGANPNSGVSAIGGFFDPNLPNTCYVFGGFYVNDTFFVGNIAAHEAGHAFGLVHERNGPASPPNEYYGGDPARSPIMGDAANQSSKRGIWWKTNMEPGQQSPDGIQDELLTLDTVIGYRPDDRGNDAASAQPMSGAAGEIYSSGVIERVGDEDWYSFNAVTASAQITIAPAANAPMLAPHAELRTAAGTLIASGVPDGAGNLTISAGTLTPGASYRIMVDGQGFYGDLGQYTVSGSLGSFASLSGSNRTIYVQGINGQADNVAIYADYNNGRIVIGDNGGTQSWGVNFVDHVVVSLPDAFNDRIDVYPINPLGNPDIRVYAGRGSDELNVYGTANVFPSSGNDLITVEQSGVTVDADGARYTDITNFNGIEHVNVWGDVGDDQFNVASLAAGADLVLYGQDGNDSATIGAGNLDLISGNVAFSGGNGVDGFTLNDSSFPLARSYLFSLGYVGVGATQFNYGPPTTENVTINGGGGGGTYDAAAVLSGINWSINAGTGDDAFILGGSFQNVTAATQGLLTINAGGGSDTLTFNDHGGSSNFVIGPDGASFSGNPGVVHYNSALDHIVINAGTGNNTINVDGGAGMTVAATVQINGGAGDDTVHVAGSTLALSNIGADVSFDGQAGADAFHVHNQNGAPQNATLAPPSVTANHTYAYAGIEYLSIDLAQSDETMYVVATAPGVNNVIYANGGNDACHFLTSDLSNIQSVTYYGQAGTDSVTVNDQDGTGSHAYNVAGSSISRGSFSFAFGEVESVELNTSNSDDAINLTGGGTPMSINSGAGSDTITLNDIAGTLNINGGGGGDSIVQNNLNAPVDPAFWRTLITDTQVRHAYRTMLPIAGVYTTHSTVNYSQVYSYVINSGYAERFEVYSTPAGTNVAMYGSADGALVRVGGSSLASAGTGVLDNILGLLQFFGAPGASNNITVDDGGDTTGDTARVIPYLIYNGEGAPLLAAGGSFNYYNASSLTLVMGSGADTVYATPGNQYSTSILGQNPTTAPGDTLNLAFAAVTNPIFTPGGGGAGTYTFGNAQPLSFSGFESSATDSIAPSVGSQAFSFDASPPAIEFTFSEDVSSQLNPNYLTLTNLTTSQMIPAAAMSLSYDPQSNRARFSFPGLPGGVLPDGNYRAVLSLQVSDLFGNIIGQNQTLDFFVLAGDANRDRSVNISDFSILASRFNQPGTFSQGDFNYNGTVDIGDFAIAASKFNTSLPVPSAAAGPAARPAANAIASRVSGTFSNQRVIDWINI